MTIKTRQNQHADDVTSDKLDANISSISKHARECTSGTVNWSEPTVLATFSDKNKNTLQRNLFICESLEIKRHETYTGKGLNDPQLHVKTNAWRPILKKLKDY